MKNSNSTKELYDQFTFNAKNPLARFAHRNRYKTGLDLIPNKEHLKLLDFGCGDGRFLNKVGEINKSAELIGFDPYMESNLFPDLTIYKQWNDLENWSKQKGLFDYVVCFEVLEHLNPSKQEEVFKMVKNVLKEDGTFIISVPIEKGFPAIFKNIRRITIHYDAKIYNLNNILASVFGYKTQWMKKHRKSEEYLSHLGFYFNDLEKALDPFFKIKEKTFSPFKRFGAQLNSQVFYQITTR